jgi:hypothetical protein
MGFLRDILSKFVTITFEMQTGTACHGKVKYGHQETAEEAAKRMNLKPTTRRYLETYRCTGCGYWHIGGR